MTVPVSDRLSQLYVGNGTNTRFDFSFRVFQQEDATGVAIRRKGTTEFETVDPATYTVTLNQDGLGGYVTFYIAPPTNFYFYIAGSTALDQLLDITNYDNFYPEALERALDKLTSLLQEWGTQLDQEKQARILADIQYDSLAMEREENLENRLISYINAVVGITNPKIFDGISDRMIITKDGRTQREFNESIPFWTDDYVNFKQETYLREEQILDHTDQEIAVSTATLTALVNDERERAIQSEQSLQAQISTSVGGIKYFETLTELNAYVPSGTDSKQAYVFETKKNYLWKLKSGSTTEYEWKDEGLSQLDQAKAWVADEIDSITKPIFESKTKNVLDLSRLLIGREVFNDGTLLAEANSVTTGLIYCKGQTVIAVSGLQNNAIQRYYRFLDSNQNLISVSRFTTITNSQIINVPSNAMFFQLSIKQRDSSPLNTATAQIEFNNVITAYTPFVSGDIVGILNTLIERPDVNLMVVAAGKNLLNVAALLKGKEVFGDGTLGNEPRSVTTELIKIKGMQSLTLSGLQPNPEIPRYYRFLDASKNLVLRAQVPNPNTNYTITVPANAEYFQLSILQRTATSLDPSITQIESGPTATSYEAFKPAMNGLNGVEIAVPAASTTNPSKAFGAKIVIFGDSTAQTSNVEAGIFDQLDYPSTTFVTYLHAYLKPTVFKNYAKGGASFLEYGQIQWRKLAHQVDTAITNNEDPSIIYVVAGTNDTVAGDNPLANLGSYETAMSKASQADLNRALTLESARYCFWRIRQKWPNAVCFYCVPLQRADVDSTARAPLNDGLKKMAERYGFNIINGHTESGIIKDLEVWGANGQFTIDGLHPNDAGKQVYSNLVISKTVPRMAF
ncbi:GDSL-type esterase/lipase family protein [Acinetobacter baumannii]|uniref:GDSL-type esterase/lipase family protein n=1 Tax=Acinetobacter baumannii TaxID=470 RepID=UPI002446B2C9|nr:GDSL-type esterase/lipase family protein [Acinetobacter baumannii]MDH2565979.1 GDSL-type esterase/lipase family protein [Acinetobacter baumannii]